ncbi:MAG: GGDEF domain-containing protein [Parvularculaceae bacterium]
MSDSIAATHRIAEVALGALKALGLAAAPKNIELWCAHIEGRNPALSRDIQKALGDDGRITQDDVDPIYEFHIVRKGLSHNVVELIQRFEDEMAKLADTIDETGESASGNTEKLRRLAHDLKTNANGDATVSAIVESVLSVTKSVRDANHRLEQQLERSSNEVVTLRRSMDRIQQEAMLDPLTGVKNRKTFDLELSRLMKEAGNDGEPLALIMADVDHFKTFNDRWGHQTGDHVLRLVAEVMNANIKGQDVLARYGGEEFAIILPGTTVSNAHMLADRIRKAIESRRLKKRRTDEDLGLITMSMGISTVKWGDTTETLIERADTCLYAAKKAGRNCVVVETDNSAETATSAA